MKRVNYFNLFVIFSVLIISILIGFIVGYFLLNRTGQPQLLSPSSEDTEATTTPPPIYQTMEKIPNEISAIIYSVQEDFVYIEFNQSVVSPLYFDDQSSFFSGDNSITVTDLQPGNRISVSVQYRGDKPFITSLRVH